MTQELKAKFTAGPWHIGGRYGAVIGGDGYQVCDPDQGPHLNENFNAEDGHWATTPMSYIERTEEEVKANAHLIAAAPEMYEALPDLSHVISWLENDCDPKKAANELRIHQERINAALTKAEGRANG